MRHAKSSWSNMTLSDLQRPLNARGRHDAPIMAQQLAAIRRTIDLLLLSPSERTRETALLVQEHVDFQRQSVVASLYHASPDDIYDVVSMVEDEKDSILLIGHNPGLTYFYNLYSDESLDNLPTCGLFRLTVDATSWSDMDRHNTKADMLLYPKMFYS